MKEQKISDEIIDDDTGTIEVEDNTLLIDRAGLIAIIKNNSDKDSREIDCKIIKMIRTFYSHFSYKQMKWILQKAKYILRHNEGYKKYRKIDDIIFL